MRGRCFFCSADSHWANGCPVKLARKQDAKAAAVTGLREAKAKGKGKPTTKGAPSLKAVQEDEAPTPAASSVSAVPIAAAVSHVPQLAQVGLPQGQPGNATQDLAREMVEVLRSLKLKGLEAPQELAVAGFTHEGSQGPFATSHVVPASDFGLIDSGATSPLRQGSVKELQACQKVTVQLAVGETELFLGDVGTLLSSEAVQPILPMAALPALGCSITWSDKGVSIRHPQKGLLPVRLNGSCPKLPTPIVLQLIRDYESLQRRLRQSVAKKLQSWTDFTREPTEDDGLRVLEWFRSELQKHGCTVELQLQFLHKMFPNLPSDVAVHVACPAEYDSFRVPFNRRIRRALFSPSTPTLLNLFSGSQRWKGVLGQVINVELKEGADMLSDDLFGLLLKASASGTVSGAIAGPPCRTSSACRYAEDSGRGLCECGRAPKGSDVITIRHLSPDCCGFAHCFFSL